jgi:ubiquinone/menaquinone biosynthesis C-methylase UbiE
MDNELRFPLEDVQKLDWGRGRHVNRFYSYMYRRFSCHILSRLSLTGSERVLVLGCGAGSDEKNIKNLFPRVSLWSVDISRAMLQHALASRSPSIFAVAAAEALPFPRACFDRVLSREVIEHVSNPQRMMQEIGRVLKPDGIAVVTTENEDSLALGNRPYGRLRSFVYRMFGASAPGTKSLFKDEAPTLNEVRGWADTANLELVDVFWDGALYKTVPRLQRLIRDRQLASLAHRLSALENLRRLAFYFCDQVKLVLRKPASGENANQSEPRFCKPGTDLPLILEEGAYVCKETGERFEVLDGIPELLPISTEVEQTEAADGLPAGGDEDSARRRTRERAAGCVMRMVNVVYGVVLIVAGLMATMFAPANRDRPSHILQAGDAYLRFIRL